MFNDDEIENLLERNYYENVSIIGSDFVHDELNNDQYNYFVHYVPEPEENDKDDQNKDNNNAQKPQEKNGKSAPATANTANASILNGRNPEEINRLIMEGLQKILRTGALPQLANRGGVNMANNPINRRNNRRRTNKVAGN